MEDITEMKVMLKEIEQRARSNTHRLDKHEKKIDDLKEQQNTFLNIATDIKVIANDMSHLSEIIDDVKTSQESIKQDFEKVKAEPDKRKSRIVDIIIEKIIILIIGALVGAFLINIGINP